jgi:hypothetical protein
MSKPQQFAVMWDCHGLEAIKRVPDPTEITFALLKGETPPERPRLPHWELRARYNTQRHYEIYIISVEVGVDQDDIEAMFTNNPQEAADTIRRIGHKYYSNRVSQHETVIR